MAQATMNVTKPVVSGSSPNHWRTLTIVLFLVALLGGGWLLYQAGVLAPLLGTSSAASGAPGMAPPAALAAEVVAPDSASAQAAVASNANVEAEVGTDVGADNATASATDTGSTALSESALLNAASAELPAEISLPALPTDSGDLTVATETTPAVATTSATASLPALTRRDGVQLWSVDGRPTLLLDGATTLRAVARSADGAWLAVSGATGSGWVASGQVIAYGIDDLPTVAAPASLSALAATSTDLSTVIEPVSEAAAGATTLPVAAEAAATLQATVATTNSRLNLRASPATSAPVVAKAVSGDIFNATARSQDGEWLLLASDESPLGWASAAWLRLGGDASTLPVSSATVDAPPVEAVTPVSLSSTSATAAVVPTVNQAVALPAAATALVASESLLTGKLAFQQSPGGTIYLYDFATETLRPLTNGFDPAISPDGTQVAFVRDGGGAGLYLINSDGSNERRIFDERGSLSSPKWSPDGSAIVFARNDEYIECYQVGPRECLVESAALDRVPSEMLDTLPFVKEYQYSLSVVDINGNNFHDLPALKSSRTPDWSAGGVVYQSSAGIQRTADGADATTQIAFEPLGPTWQDPDVSPDGGRILYQVQGAAQWDLWVMNADGSGRTGLTRPATTLLETLPSNVAAAWSPDGSQIVFLSNRTDTNTAGAWRLWVMDADGSNQRPLDIDLPLTYTFGAEQVVSWGG